MKYEYNFKRIVYIYASCLTFIIYVTTKIKILISNF